MPFIRQTSFLAGELAPFMWGRTDLKEYAHGLRQCKNFIISKAGPAISRPGTRYIAATKAIAFQPPARLIPYIYSDTVSFVIELGNLYARFYTNGTRVEGSPGVPTEISHHFTGTQAATCYWSQSGAKLFLTHPDVRPIVIYRDSGGTWHAEDHSLYVEPLQSRNLPSQAEKRLNPRLLDVPTDYLFLEDDAHKAKPWIWFMTATMVDTNTGIVFETRPVRVTKWTTALEGGTETDLTSSDLIVLAPDHPVTLTRPDSTSVNEDPLDKYTVQAYNFYRGQGDVTKDPTPDAFLVGYIGSTMGVNFIDDGREPNYSIRPMLSEFAYESPYSSVIKYPTCSGFFQDRMIFGGMNGKPETLHFSAAGNYLDFDRRPVPYPTMPLELELASRYRERIQAMVTLEKLVALTDAAIWLVGPTQGPFSYDDVYAHVVDEVGSLCLPPLVSLGRVLYARTKGLGIRMLVPSQDRLGLRPVDVTTVASHLFEDPVAHKIRSWAYAEDPWGLTWVVRVSGSQFLSAVTHGDSFGWSRHATGEENGDLVYAVCSVPEGTSEGVYISARRTDGGVEYVERMENRLHLNKSTDGSCLDSCIMFTVSVSGTELPIGTTLSGLDHLEGRSVWISGYGIPPQGPLTVVSGDVVTVAPIPKNHLGTHALFYVGLPFTCEMETLDVPGSENQTKQKQVVSVGFEVDRSKGLWVGQDADHLVEWRQRSVGAGYAGISAATETVKVMVQGSWNMGARAFLRQTEPIPVTVLGITREVDIGS